MYDTPKNEKYDVFFEYAKESSYIEREYEDIAVDDCLLSWMYFYLLEGAFNINHILWGHYLLQKNLRPDIAGRLRQMQVWVGSNECPPYMEVQERLDDWLAVQGSVKTIEQIRRSHVEFEIIHPFEDGNGRIGRHIMNWQLLQNGHDLHIIHEGEEQQEYYKWFD